MHCVQLVADRAPASLRDGMDRLVGLVERGRCPADDVTDEATRTGTAAMVSRLARSQS
jgi:glutamate--cysteine ligase